MLWEASLFTLNFLCSVILLTSVLIFFVIQKHKNSIWFLHSPTYLPEAEANTEWVAFKEHNL